MRVLFGTLLLLGALLLTLSLPSDLSAHATLLRTNPLANAVLTQAPEVVQLWFSEPIERRFSRIEVHRARRDPASGTVQPVDKVDEGWVPGPRLARDMAVRLPAQLPPGLYLVQWAVLSVDSHRVNGAFSFSYTPPHSSDTPTSANNPSR